MLQIAFLETETPPSSIFLTWDCSNKKIEEIMKKYGLIQTGRIYDGKYMNGFINKENYMEALKKGKYEDPFDRRSKYLKNLNNEKKINEL